MLGRKAKRPVAVFAGGTGRRGSNGQRLADRQPGEAGCGKELVEAGLAPGLLAGEIEQPSDFPEERSFNVELDWSHVLDGHYSGSYEPPLQLIPFLPAENRETIVQIARGMEVGEFLEDVWTDPEMGAVTSEAVGMPERFLQLYRTDRLAGDGSELASVS